MIIIIRYRAGYPPQMNVNCEVTQESTLFSHVMYFSTSATFFVEESTNNHFFDSFPAII